jgi:hypothetical protein
VCSSDLSRPIDITEFGMKTKKESIFSKNKFFFGKDIKEPFKRLRQQYLAIVFFCFSVNNNSFLFEEIICKIFGKSIRCDSKMILKSLFNFSTSE